MKVKNLLFLLLILKFSFAINLYSFESAYFDFNLDKEIFIDDSSIVKFTYLGFKDANSNVYAEYNGKIYLPTEKYDDYNNLYYEIIINNVKGNIYIHNNYTMFNKVDFNLKDYNLYISPNSEYVRKTKYIFPNTRNTLILAKKVKKETILKTLLALDEWIRNNVTYELHDGYLNGKIYNSEEMFIKRKGFCVEYVNLASAVLRTLKIPTKIVVGIVSTGNTFGMHAWLKVQVDKNKFISYDPTYHEIGFLNVTHLIQGEFADYSEIQNLISLTTKNYSIESKYNPLDLKVKMYNEKKLNPNINYKFKKILKPKEPLKICILNKDNYLKYFKLNMYFHNSFSPTEITDFVLLDRNVCYLINTPKVKYKTKYSFFVSFLTYEDEPMLTILPETVKLTVKVNNVSLNNNILVFDLDINSNKPAEIQLFIIDGKRVYLKTLDLEKGKNYFKLSQIVKSNIINLKLVQNDSVLWQTVLNIELNKNFFEENLNVILILFIFSIILALLLIWRLS